MNPEHTGTLGSPQDPPPSSNEGVETLLGPALGPRNESADSTVSMPEQIERFHLQRLLGQGGMGEVWEAWDPELRRQVAIKRLLTPHLAARQRFLREARLQATLAHPGICPVFEVGQHDGEPYLVMPRLDGAPLDSAVEGAPLEYKLKLLRQVAEAVHAAHEQGLIHRDLKPANILVETPHDAPVRPVVLDFGIARSLEGEGLTASGEIVGTPAYMAPEQVEGKISQLDRRTDVYALGATLYRLLVGRTPHQGEGTPLMLGIIHDEPERLPAAEIPAEVEAIVFKCLEKNKNNRYESARALADDLGRYLAGEPVKARPVTRWIRFRKWSQRHRVAVRATSTATLVALAALVWGSWSAWRSEERQEVARRFGAQVEEIEALARYSHLVPLHDVREDQKQLRARLDAIRPSLKDRDSVVRSLAAHAMGRGHLALDELETARDYLETAYELNPENSEIAADLGRSLSELYRERLTHLERIRDQAGRESIREELSSRLQNSFGKLGDQRKQWQLTFGEPARELLTQAQDPESNGSIELDALVLFHDDKPQEALDLLAESPPAPAWFYDRLHLEGDIRRSWGAVLASDNDTQDQGREQLEEARRVYSRALEVAESHDAILRADAQTVALLVQMRLVPQEGVEALIEEARTRLIKAQKINPENLQTWLWVSRIELAEASFKMDLSLDPSSFLDSALNAGKKALELNRGNSAAWFELAQTHERLARWQLLNSRDPSASYSQAFQAFERVDPKDRDYFYFLRLGVLQLFEGAGKTDRGFDAGNSYREAIASFRSAAETHPRPFGALINLGSTLFNSARVEGADFHKILNQAISALEEAQKLRPDRPESIYYIGLCQMRLAQGGNPLRTIVERSMAELATTSFEKAIELAPERLQPWVGLGEISYLQAITTYSRGEDPAAFFSQARDAYRRALDIAPNQSAALLNLGWTAYYEGRFKLKERNDPTVYLAEAESLCQRALDMRPGPKSLLCLGSVWRMRAEQHSSLGKLEQANFHTATAEKVFRKILSFDSNHADAYRSLGRLFTLKARIARQAGEDPSQALSSARSLLDRALDLENSVIDFHLADARWYLEHGRWLSASQRDYTSAVKGVSDSLRKIFDQVEVSSEASCIELEVESLIAPVNLLDPQSPSPIDRCRLTSFLGEETESSNQRVAALQYSDQRYRDGFRGKRRSGFHH